MLNYITADEAAKKRHISVRRLQILCSEGRVEGAVKHRGLWAIPKDAVKPEPLKPGKKENDMGILCDLNNVKDNMKTYNKYPVISCIGYDKTIEYFNSYTHVSLGQELSQRLLKYDRGKRREMIFEELNKIISNNKSKNILVSEIDMLFNPDYDIDILRFFINVNRTKNLVVIWSGKVNKNQLIYSESKYRDYQSYDVTGFDILCLK